MEAGISDHVWTIEELCLPVATGRISDQPHWQGTYS